MRWVGYTTYTYTAEDPELALVPEALAAASGLGCRTSEKSTTFTKQGLEIKGCIRRSGAGA